jgi:hypothetical protein
MGTNLVGVKDFLFLRTSTSTLGAHIKMGTWVLIRGRSARRVKQISHLHLLPNLRMSDVKPLLPLHAFMEWTEKKLTYLFSMLLVLPKTFGEVCNSRLY